MNNYFRVLMGLGFISVLVGLAACSTASVRVMPGADGVNTVVSRDIEKDGAETAAVDAANDYCKKKKKSAVFMGGDKTEYTGTMDEKTRETARRASQASSAGAGAIGGFKQARNGSRDNQIRKLENERREAEMTGHMGRDQASRDASQKRLSDIDAQIGKLRSEQDQAGGGAEEVAAVAGVAGQAFTSGKDYKNEIRFKCE
jgi:hypothetical protein